MQFIIDFVDTVTAEQVEAYLNANKCTVLKTFSAFDKTYLVKATKKPLQDPLVASIVKDAATSMKLLGYEPAAGDVYPMITFNTDADEQWWKVASFGLPNFDAPTQTYERRGQPGVVYVVDSGVDSGHPDLEHADIKHLYSFNGDVNDMNGHGTAIASLISGNTCGVSAAKVVSVKLFQSGVETLQSNFIEALNAILVDCQTSSTTFPIVNLSWSIAKNEYIESKIRMLLDAGIYVVASAGNSGIPIENVTPASMAGVITVGAYSRDLVPCDFSNYTGPVSTTEGEVNHGAIDVWAPGEFINVATLDGATGLASGTSLSAAIVSACLAYNSNVFMFEDGTLPINATGSTIVTDYSSSKIGVLTLEGKYAESVNMCACLRGEYDGDNGINYATISNFTIVAQSGELIQKLAFHSMIVDSYTIEKPLPEGISIDSNGWLSGTIVSDEPFLWESPLTYTKKNGFVQNSKMTFIVFPPGVTQEDLPEGDPILSYSLAACLKSQSGGIYNCGGGCSGAGAGGFCHDACGQAPTKYGGDVYCSCGEVYCP